MYNKGNPRKQIIFLTVVLFSVCNVNAAILFSENWESGVINPSRWSVSDPGGTDIVLEDLGGGDYALALKGYQDGGNPAWGDAIYSVAGYNRADNVTVMFKVWYKSGVNVQVGMQAGWHKSKSGQVYASNEATVDYIFSAFKAGEAGDGLQAGPLMANFNAAWGSASSKNGALLVKITLDPIRGAKWEYSTDGAVWITERNTIGTGTSLTSLTYIGFGPFHGQAGTTMIDDITVETNDSGGGPDPLPDDIRDLTQHFNNPGEDIAPWIFIPQSNISQFNTLLHPGLAMIYEAGQGQDVKGILNQPIAFSKYQTPWEMQLCIQQAFNVTAGRSSSQLNTAIGLNIALTFSDPGSWPEDRTQQPPNTHSFQLFNVHLGNYGEVGSGLPQLVNNPILYRMGQDNTEEAYFVYGRGDLAAGQSASGLWDIPYIWIGDGAKYAGPASNQIYFKCKILNSTQIQVGIKFDASHGWNTKIINVGQYGSITGIWEIGPIISADRWIPDTLSPALGITPPPDVDVPDPAYEYYIDYCVFKHGVPIPFEHYSDDFNIPGWMGQWQIQEQGTIVETYSNPGYLTMTLLGCGLGTGFGPESAPEFSLTTYPPPWEKEVCFIPPDDSDPWMFYLGLVAYGPNPSNYVIFLPGVKNIPGSGHSFMTGVGGDSPFQPQWPTPLPESLLSSKPLYMIFQMVDTLRIRLGFKSGTNESWHYSDVYDTSATMPGGVISKWGLGCWSTTTGIINGGYGGPAYQKFLIDYVHYRYGLTDMIDIEGSQLVAEQDTTSDTYTIVCTGVPTSNVTITVAPDDQLEINNSGQGNPVQLTFTPATAKTPQIINVRAIDDANIEGPHVGRITHTAGSSDPYFNNITVETLIVDISDNDHGCGESGQVYSDFDVTGLEGTPDCNVDFYDFAAFAAEWMNCSDLSRSECSW